MRRNDKNQIEFRFLGNGGSGKGPWGIAAFVLLGVCAMVTIVLLAKAAPLFASMLGSTLRWR